VPVAVTKDQSAQLIEAITALTRRRVMIGIPAEDAKREAADGGGITNAQIGYINEFGMPDKNIPPRPHLIPAVAAYSASTKCHERLRRAAIATLDSLHEREAPPKPINAPHDTLAQMVANGRKAPITDAVTKALTAVGIEAVSAVKTKIVDVIPPPLKPATLAARKRAGFEGETPLIRTSDYMRHIQSVIRKV
jgi:hypothetical protein